MCRFFFSCCLVLLSLPIHAEGLLEHYASFLTPPRTYTCLHTSERIKIDGRLSERAWRQAPPSAPFVDIRGEGHPTPLYRTTAQLLWDEDFLYIAATLIEPNIVSHLRQRDTIIWKENDFEVFLDPMGKGTYYYEFEVNARGTMMDLLMTQPYRSEGAFIMPWNCEGLRHAIHIDGTLNRSNDTDRQWTVEMAIPIRSLRHDFAYTRGGTAGEVWRLNFSRVQWLNPTGPEENWVWSPTGKVDIHMPERWGYLHFAQQASEPQPSSTFTPTYRLLWALFYAQFDNYQQHKQYASTLATLGVTSSDLATLPPNTLLELEATSSQFKLQCKLPDGSTYQLDHRGEYRQLPSGTN